MTSVLHFADLHLDRPYTSLAMAPSEANKRREELRAALRRIVDLALELQVDALTVGGDLYEHHCVQPDTGNFIAEQFRRLMPKPVLIAPGNHDPYVPESLYRRKEWPANVRIFDSMEWRPEAVGDSLAIWGVGHAGPTIRDNLLRDLQVSGDRINVAMFHGSDIASLPEGKPVHAPFERDDIARSGVDFALLGHYHAMRVPADDAPKFAYPGSPEPLDFSEEGAHYVLLLTAESSKVSVEPLQINEVDYETKTIDVAGMSTSDQLRIAISALAPPNTRSRAITRVILAGQLDPDLDLDTKALLDTCADKFRYLDPIVNRTEIPIDIANFRDEVTTRGAFVRLIDKRLESVPESEAEIVREALVYGLRAFEGLEIRSR